MCEFLFLFVLCQNVMYYCTTLSAVFDWMCALQVFIIIIIIIIIIIVIKAMSRERKGGVFSDDIGAFSSRLAARMKPKVPVLPTHTFFIHLSLCQV